MRTDPKIPITEELEGNRESCGDRRSRLRSGGDPNKVLLLVDRYLPKRSSSANVSRWSAGRSNAASNAGGNGSSVRFCAPLLNGVDPA